MPHANPRARRLHAVLLLVLPALLLMLTDSAADPPASEASLRARQQELRALKAEITEKRKQIATLRQEGQDVEAILAELERERAMTERYLRTLAAQEQELEHDIARRRDDLSRQEEAIARVRGGLAAALLRFYKEERVTAAELLVSSGTFSEVFARAHYWGRAVGRLRSRVDELARRRGELRDGLAEVEARRGRVGSLRRERETQVRKLREEETVRRRHREELESTIALYEEQTRKLLASQERIEKLITAAQLGEVYVGAGLERLRGSLPWPVRGPVLTRFGTHIHPKYGTRVRQKGVEIAAAEGVSVQAVAPGRAAFVGWLEGYGRTVILDHGEGYFTLYAHASATLIAQGALVSAGEEIARVGSTESLRGSVLHFEIRQGREALDPADWLRREGGS